MNTITIDNKEINIFGETESNLDNLFRKIEKHVKARDYIKSLRYKKKGGQSGVKGVTKFRNKYISYYGSHGERVHIGRYNTIEEAVKRTYEYECSIGVENYGQAKKWLKKRKLI